MLDLAEKPVELTTEQRIRDVSTLLFYEQGYHATSMREIAAAVGITAAALYNHFSSKQDLLYGIVVDTTRTLLDGALSRVAASEGPAARLRALVEWHVAFHAQNRHAAKVADDQLHALEPEGRKTAVAIRDRYEQLLKDILVAGREQASWSVEEPAIITFAVTTMCTQVGVWFREDGRLSAEEIGRIYADFVLGRLEGRPL